MSDAFSSAISGISSSSAPAAVAANNITMLIPQDLRPPAKTGCDMKQEHGYSASAAVIRTQDEMLGTLLDMLA